jgi:hypothetical protein
MSEEGTSRTSSTGVVNTINSFAMGRLHGKNAIVTGAAGSVMMISVSFFPK